MFIFILMMIVISIIVFIIFFFQFRRRNPVLVGGQSTKRLARWESSWAYFYCVGCRFFFGKNTVLYILLSLSPS